MQFSMEIIVLLLVILRAKAAYGPSNKAVVSRQDVVMNCGSNESVSRQWKFKDVDEHEITLSYESNISMADSHSISLNSSTLGLYALNLSQTERGNVGTYICILEESMDTGSSSKIRRTDRYEAYLAILNSEPKCSTNASDTNYTVTEGDVIEAQCSVVYSSVNNNLRMEWRREDGSVFKAKTITSNNTTGIYKVTSSIAFNVTYEDNGLQLICYTYFTESNESNSSDPLLHRATNAPDYSHTYSIPQLNVQYMPRNVTILQQIGDISQPDDCYYCHGEGNPKPECKWTITSAKENISLSGCLLCPEEYKFSDAEIIIECEVTNKIGKSATKMKINVTANRSDTATATATESNTSNYNPVVGIAAFVVTLILVGIIIIIIIIYLYNRRRCRIKDGIRHRQTVIPINTNHDGTENGLTLYSMAGPIEHDNEMFSNIGFLYNDTPDQAYSEFALTNCQTDSQDNFPGPVYEEVKIVDSDLKEDINKHQTVGADGTVYTRVDMSKGERTQHENSHVMPRYEKSNYSSIDHSFKIPPPPPKLNFK